MKDIECHGLDTPVYFREREFSVLSNAAPCEIHWKGWLFETAEAVLQWEKLDPSQGLIRNRIRNAVSAREAIAIALAADRSRWCPNWGAVEAVVLRAVLLAKALQNEYVRRKLLATGDRELVGNSDHDDYRLGKFWMEIRAELRARDSGGVAP